MVGLSLICVRIQPDLARTLRAKVGTLRPACTAQYAFEYLLCILQASTSAPPGLADPGLLAYLSSLQEFSCVSRDTAVRLSHTL